MRLGISTVMVVLASALALTSCHCYAQDAKPPDIPEEKILEYVRSLKDAESLPTSVKTVIAEGIDDQIATALAKRGRIVMLRIFDSPKLTTIGLQSVGSIEGLKELAIFNSSGIDAPAAGKIASNVSLTALRVVNCKYVQSDAVSAVAKSSSIRTLTLSSIPEVDDSGFRPFAQNVSLAELSLLCGDKITDNTLGYIASLSNLSKLQFHAPKVTDEGLTKLRSLKSLKSLELSGNELITGAFSRTLFAELELEELTLYFCGAIELVKLEFGKSKGSLKRLFICGAKLATDRNLDNILQLSLLEELTLSSIDCVSGKLAELPIKLPSLRKLDLSSTDIADADLAIVARCTKVDDLNLYSCPKITDEGLIQLATLKRANRIKVYSCSGLTEAGVKKLREALPNCEVTSHGMD